MVRTLSALLLFIFICLLVSISGAQAQIPGDVNDDSLVDVGDVVYEINYLFKNGPPPIVYECGDPTADCVIDVGDVVYLINYLFKKGAKPDIVDCGWSEPVNLGLPINSPNGEESFRTTVDGRMAVWSSNRPGSYGNNDIWYSFWDSVSGSWSEPQNCGPNVNTDLQDLGPCLSPDGKQLYCVEFARSGGNGGWEIWVSTWNSVNHEWGVLENLGPIINSTGAEWSPFVSPDGYKLYFSNAWGIWVSEWNGSEWGTPVWLDTTVNSTLGEKHATVTADNQTIYFTRLWFKWCIWVSHWTGTGWGTARCLGPQVNDSIGAVSCYITPDGSKLYFISGRPGGIGSGDFWVSERIPMGKKKHSGERK
jgi:hypothetical protein